MPTAEGSINYTSGPFVFIFPIGQDTYEYTGSFGTSVPPFISKAVTLTYDSLRQLTAVRYFSGILGGTKVVLNLVNGIRIEGSLEEPLHPSNTLSGTGVWKIEN
ncbi:hypothetical protein B0H34DRAFT_257165 [Crassisporium funariophilum]|nr:hypothetical protein B0H34DRAFT_257165 [Crassisporium funariophilum]